MIKLMDIIVLSAERGMSLQNENGSMPPGINGPRLDIETPVRNTAHWIITFLKAFDLTGRSAFKLAASRAADYLITNDCRPMGAAFFCRKTPDKNQSNGLIGQAWAVEALSLANEKLNNSEYGNVATKVFSLHPFDHQLGLWSVMNVDGSSDSIASTINHQLWFAAAGALLCRHAGPNEGIRSTIRGFLNKFQNHCALYRNGLICHAILGLYRKYRRIKQHIYWPSHLRLKYSKRCMQQSIGYHAFNLYALALLETALQTTVPASMRKGILAPALKHSVSSEFRKSQSHNIYAFSYNPVGFEMAFALSTFSTLVGPAIDVQSTIRMWIERQLQQHFSVKQGLMGRNTMDPNTLAARIYEATRLSDIEVDVRAE